MQKIYRFDYLRHITSFSPDLKTITPKTDWMLWATTPIKHVGFVYNWFQCAYHKNLEIWISFKKTSNNYTAKGPNCDICMATKKKAINLAN